MIQWGNIAEWVGGIATLIASIIALMFGLSEQRRQRLSKRRSQAEKITIYGLGNTLHISNSSNEPVFEMAISFGVAYGAGLGYSMGSDNQVFLLRVPPGKYVCHQKPTNPGGGMHIQLGLSISFRDAAGLYWRREANGVLIETLSAYSDLDVEQPISDWSPLFPDDQV